MTQPESITRAISRLRRYLELGGEFEEGNEPDDYGYEDRSEWRDRHSSDDLWVLANAYARELDTTPISAEALVADGWVNQSGTGAYEIQPGRIGCPLVYEIGGGEWAMYLIPDYRNVLIANTMGRLRTLLRLQGVSR